MKTMQRLSLCVALSLFAAHSWAQANEAFTIPSRAPESAQETAAKQVVLNWFRLVFIEGNAQEAFSAYASRDFVEHSRRARGGYESTLTMLSKMPPRELHPQAVVNDEIVFVQSEIGKEVFRVQNGKITDHWEVNP